MNKTSITFAKKSTRFARHTHRPDPSHPVTGTNGVNEVNGVCAGTARVNERNEQIERSEICEWSEFVKQTNVVSRTK